MGNDINPDLNTEEMSQLVKGKKAKGIRGVKFWSLPPLIEVYTMKKFNTKNPTIMRIERIAENAHQNLINSSQRKDWNDKVPIMEKI